MVNNLYKGFIGNRNIQTMAQVTMECEEYKLFCGDNVLIISVYQYISIYCASKFLDHNKSAPLPFSLYASPEISLWTVSHRKYIT